MSGEPTAATLQIRQIRDPSLFQRFVSKLMIAEHGVEYQVVDDSGGDGGLDGFLRGPNDLYACYCPEKPETAGIHRKIRDDLKRARTLRDTHQYPIRRFIFVTPFSLREPAQRLIRDEARKLGFEDGLNIADEYLETVLARHLPILDQFPELNYQRIAEELRGIREDIKALSNALPAATSARTAPPSDPGATEEPQTFTLALFENIDSRELEFIKAALAGGEPDAIFRLEQFRLGVRHPALAATASIVELEHLLEQRDFAAAEPVAERGAREAHAAGLRAEEALFRSHLVRMLVFRGSEIDLRIAGAMGVSYQVGMQLFDKQKIDTESAKVVEIYARVDNELHVALALAHETANLTAMYWALNAMAFAEVHRAQSARFLVKTGLLGAESFEKARSRARAAHETAIRTAHLLDDESLAQAYHSYANDLRLFDETDRALYFAKEARTIAERVRNTYQLNLSVQLIQALEGDLRESKP
jgi:hypothetical protein